MNLFRQYVCFIPFLVILLMTSCSQDEVVQPPVTIQIDNRVAVKFEKYYSKPTTATIYLGHYPDSPCDLCRPTYISLEEVESDDGDITLIDSEGKSTDKYLLPAPDYLPYDSAFLQPTFSADLRTEYNTYFMVKFDNEEEDGLCTYYFKLRLVQPDIHAEYITKLISLHTGGWGSGRWYISMEVHDSDNSSN